MGLEAKKYPGYFISFEGPDGSGKSTAINKVVEYLQQLKLHRNIVVRREPGGTNVGEITRDILHDPRHREMQPRAEILLYTASRAELVGEVIIPELNRGSIVLLDRYKDSTEAYQGYGRGLDLQTLRTLNNFATHELLPDLTLLFDLDPEIGIKRRLGGNEEMNRLDMEDLKFHQAVRAGYLAMADSEPGRWRKIDATLSRETTALQAMDHIINGLTVAGILGTMQLPLWGLK